MIKTGVLVLAAALAASSENTTSETEKLKSLSEVKNLQIFGDLITILEKNVTETTPEGDPFDEYIRNHLIRIKSPLQEDKYLDFELGHLIPTDESEGRQKKRKGMIRDVLVPLLLAIKHKLSVALPLFLAMVTFVAFKAFWAGMTGLVISKVIGLKLLVDAQNKQDDGKDESDDQDEHNEEGHDDEKPIVVFLNPHGHNRRISNRRHRPAGKRYYSPEGWDPWGKQRDFERENWDGNRLDWEREPWI